jgi:hypothetical protein
MSADIRSVLRGGAALPRSPLDLEAATLRARWLAWLRRIRVAAVVLVVCLVVAGGLPLLSEWIGAAVPPPAGPPSTDDAFVPARPGQATHVLSDLGIEYPYLGVPDRMKGRRRDGYCRIRPKECRRDPNRAGVTYTVAWSTEDFPGDTRCRITLQDASGAEVGTTTFSLTVMDPSLVRPRSSELPVRVDREPSSASAVCEAGDYQPGPGYRLDLVDVKRHTPTRTWLIFDVEFLVPEPDTRTCNIVVHLDGGRTRRFDDFTLTTGENGRQRFTVPIRDPNTVADAEAPCRTYILEAGGD